MSASRCQSTFLHELQHLISFSQHVVDSRRRPEYGWLDEGLSIVAEELGSLYYEQKCPGTACRTNPSQVFPDSSQGFVSRLPLRLVSVRAAARHGERDAAQRR